MHLYLTPEVVAWVCLTVIGTVSSFWSLQTLRAVHRWHPNAEPLNADVVDMTRNDTDAETARLVAHVAFLILGVRMADGAVPPISWEAIVGYAVLVYNSIKAWRIGRRLYKRKLARLVALRSRTHPHPGP